MTYTLNLTPIVDVPNGEAIIPVHVVRPSGWTTLSASLSKTRQAFAAANRFTGEAGQTVNLPGDDGQIDNILLGCGEVDGDMDAEMRAGQLATSLPAGFYRFETLPEDWSPRLATLAWGMGGYRFGRYLKDTPDPAMLVLGDDLDAALVMDAVRATALGRDLINTPAGDMGPVALQEAAEALAHQHDANVRATIGETLLEQNYPMIHAVGRAAHEAPRLVEIEWGDPDHPRLALIGKGITFDTGGVNMKSASGARLMKKDMGGAAHALALSSMIMAAKLPIRLHCLLAIAENAVSANAYRPGDVLSSRAGLTVEIDNTDAEGRLVLGDALTRASEDDPVLMIDFATLTGAARVALGPQLPPFFTNRPQLHDAVARHAMMELDPVWPMPLWQPYHSMLRSPIADMKNAGGSFAGSVTAALFLERFVAKTPWMHFDVYGWNPTTRPGHPKGADVYAVRALFSWLASGGLNTPMDGDADA
ncbi:MAG: leucyl aminopeptidase family protein [Pseudomonadota bacterium]